jgi:DNA-binding NtrC family response regulator
VATILLVDDEPAIRALVSRVLERHGHKVIVCAGATQALSNEDPIDLLLVDFSLPDMNGAQLTEQLRARMPALPVILMSGYPPSDSTPEPPSSFLQKPMLPSAVVQAVEKLLAEAT